MLLINLIIVQRNKRRQTQSWEDTFILWNYIDLLPLAIVVATANRAYGRQAAERMRLHQPPVGLVKEPPRAVVSRPAALIFASFPAACVRRRAAVSAVLSLIVQRRPLGSVCPLYLDAMPHAHDSRRIEDPFGATDEVKVYKDEGEAEKPENLSEEKFGLVTETEEVKMTVELTNYKRDYKWFPFTPWFFYKSL